MRSRRLHAGPGGFGALVLMSIALALGGLGCSGTAIVAEHAQRIASLTQKLAASSAPPTELTEEDERRLKALGYLE